MTTKESDIRLTPEWLLALVREFHGGPIDLDPCTEPHNPTGALHFLTACGDAIEWHVSLRSLLGDSSPRLVWVNPPYSAGQVKLWADRAIEEARHGLDILFLTKDDCRPGWNGLLRKNCDARCRIAKGVGFLEPDGQGGYTQLVAPRWGSCLWYFGRRRRRFDRIFSAIGEVIHGLGPVEPQVRL